MLHILITDRIWILVEHQTITRGFRSAMLEMYVVFTVRLDVVFLQSVDVSWLQLHRLSEPYTEIVGPRHQKRSDSRAYQYSTLMMCGQFETYYQDFCRRSFLV
jgi:hypothetical protein